MLKLYSVNIDICATAYIQASSPEIAANLARGLANGVLEIAPGICGDVEISGKRFDDLEMPLVSLSPVMTIQGPRGIIEIEEV